MVSVQSKNLFDVLAGSGDEGDVTTASSAIAIEKKSPAATAAKKKTHERAEQGSIDSQKKENRPPRENRVRNEYPPRGGHANKTVSLRSKDQDAAGSGGEKRPAYRGDRGPRNDDTREYHHRDKTDHRHGARGGPQGGRGRLYDRHSGGYRDSEKKASQGWGDPTENPDEVPNSATTTDAARGDLADPWAASASASAVNDSWATPADSDPWAAAPVDKVANGETEDPGAAARAAELRRQQEEEDKQKTLDEYLAEKTAARSLALPEARKANEGADTTQWKDAIVLKHDGEEECLFTGKTTGKGKGRKERSTKTVVEIEQRFAPRPRPDRGNDGFGVRRDRGGFRGGEGGGRGRGSDQRPSRNVGERNLNVSDENAFPTLR